MSKPINTKPSFIRRLSGVYHIRTSLISNNAPAWADTQIRLDTNVTGLNNYYTNTEGNNSLALKTQINNPKFTGTVSTNGTLVCLQLNPISSQNDFNTIKAPGLYQYDRFNGSPIPNALINSLNFRSIEIGSDGRYSQIAMPCDAEQIFF